MENQNKKPRADAVDKEVGTRVRALRDGKGMSQAVLAEKCGITFQQIQKYENGTNRIACGRLAQIAEAMETPIWYFFPPEMHADDGKFYLELEKLRREILQYRAFIKAAAGNLLNVLKDR